jgi:hypothetical protein
MKDNWHTYKLAYQLENGLKEYFQHHCCWLAAVMVLDKGILHHNKQ